MKKFIPGTETLAVGADYDSSFRIALFVSGLISGIVALVLGLLGVAETVFFTVGPGKNMWFVFWCTTLYCAVALGYTFAFPLVPARSFVIEEGRPTRRFEKRRIMPFWQFRKICRNLYSYETKQDTLVMEAHPITDNPKVRDLSYDVSIEYAGEPEDSILFETMICVPNQSARKVVYRHLYDLNEQHSRELARFSNPLQDEQQREFAELVKNFLEPRLAGTGIRFTGAVFSLN